MESWMPINSLAGFYEASTLGRIRRADSGKILVLRKNTRGYLAFTPSIHNVILSRVAHSCICEAFHGRRPDGCECAHINGIKTDNRPENLCWCTHKENEQMKEAHGTKPTGSKNGAHTKPHRVARGSRANKSKLTEQTVLEIRELRKSGIGCYRIWKRFNFVSFTAIKNILKRKTWTHI